MFSRCGPLLVTAGFLTGFLAVPVERAKGLVSSCPLPLKKWEAVR